MATKRTPRAKKATVEEAVPLVEVKRYGIDLLGNDSLGREDLNLLRDKINEIITHLDTHGR